MSFMETLFLFTIITLIISQDGITCAKKSRKNQKWKQKCVNHALPWQECSKPCEMGIAFREVITPKCKTRRESRLCIIRHCNVARFKTPIKGKSRCLKLFRSREKEHLKYIGAVSEKGYKMKYCGVCEDANKCCTPTKSKTRKVQFRRKDGSKFVKKVAFIRKCSCHRNCKWPLNVYTVPLYKDTERRNGTASYDEQRNELPDSSNS